MRKTGRVLVILLMVVAVTISGCGGHVGGTANIAPTPSPTLSADNYWPLVTKAQTLFASADFAAAMKTAQQAIAIHPDDNTAWHLYRQAVIAQAGDDYLQHLPESRYRLPVKVFVRDRVNHARAWVVIDVRDKSEFAAGHIDGAINIPFREILHHLDELPNSKTAPILLYCHTQKRATHALVVLHELGYLKVYNLEGGYAAYEDWMKHNAIPTPGPTPTPGPEEPDFGC